MSDVKIESCRMVNAALLTDGLWIVRDSVAVEVTAEMLARVLRTIAFPPGMRTVENLAQGLAPRVIADLLKGPSNG